MRWQRIAVAVGGLIGWGALPGAAQAGWLSILGGGKGSAEPSAVTDFWFDTPHAAPVVAVTSVTGGRSVTAGTGGGTTVFGGLATPVLLNLADGSAYLAGGDPPAGATTRGPAGGSAGSPASAAPATLADVPSNAALLGLAFVDLADGARGLTATVTNGAGGVLGADSVVIPADGWWVIGLGPDQRPAPAPDPIPEPTPVPVPVPVPVPNPGPVAGVPEPGTLAAVGSGATAVALRRLRRAVR